MVGLAEEKQTLLWRKGRGRTATPQGKALTRFDVFDMLRRRARTAGIADEICCYTLRATSITVCCKSGGTFDGAQKGEITLNEIERIQISSLHYKVSQLGMLNVFFCTNKSNSRFSKNPIFHENRGSFQRTENNFQKKCLKNEIYGYNYP